MVEQRRVYEAGLACRAAAPDFLLDLENLILRLEALVSFPNLTLFEQRSLLSNPVEVNHFNHRVGSEEEIGGILYFRITGATNGRIWGTDIYTYDSPIGVAAVHAGFIKPDQSGIAAARVLPGQKEYHGSTQNGVTSVSYGNYNVSYEFVSLDESTPLIKDPGHLGSYRNFTGHGLAFQITGSAGGGIWDTGIYNLASAAVHAGLLRPDETGIILVEFLPGQESYTGTDNFGVSSRSFGGYPYSYRLKNFYSALGSLITRAEASTGAQDAISAPGKKSLKVRKSCRMILPLFWNHQNQLPYLHS